MTFPRVAAPKRGHKTDYYQMSKIFGGLLGYAVGFSLIYEYFNKGISRRREAWRNEPKRDMSASAVADRAQKYLQQNLVPGMSGVAQKEYNRRMDEAKFPKEIKEHVEKSQGVPEWDSYKSGVVGKFVVSRSREKQAAIDARQMEQQNKSDEVPAPATSNSEEKKTS